MREDRSRNCVRLLGAALAAGTMVLDRPVCAVPSAASRFVALALQGLDLPLKLTIVAWSCGIGDTFPSPRSHGRWRGGRCHAGSPLSLHSAVVARCRVRARHECPAGSGLARLLGQNAFHCMTLIPLARTDARSFPDDRAEAMCAGANPGVAGAFAGLAASGIGASLYALSCPEDSPLFVATWYSLAIAVFTASCFLAGRRWLRW